MISRYFLKPSDGLEPSTPSLPFRGISDWNRAFGVNECAFFEMSTSV